MISKQLLSILGCPACEDRPPVSPLVENSKEYLFCRRCRRRYPVRDDIPVMLVEEAEIAEGENNSTH